MSIDATHGTGDDTGAKGEPVPLGLPAFDAHRPPDPALVSDCVHCGFCLPTCPTYSLWGEEMDSPRGRIQLMSQGLNGEPLSDSMVTHFDRCLGCMACVPACPSGVQYDKLIEATRAQVERNYPRSIADRLFRRMLFALFPHPRRLRAASVAAAGDALAGWKASELTELARLLSRLADDFSAARP